MSVETEAAPSPETAESMTPSPAMTRAESLGADSQKILFTHR